MNSTEKYILAPVSLPFSETNAFLAAVRIAIANKRPLKLVHVVDPKQKGGLFVGRTAENQTHIEVLQTASSDLEKVCKETLNVYSLLLDCTFEVVSGPVKDTLLKVIEQNTPEWTVMSDFGKLAFLSKVLGNLPAAIAKSATSPVLIVPDGKSTFMPNDITYVTRAKRDDHEGFVSVARLARNFRANLKVVEVTPKLPARLAAEEKYRRLALQDMLGGQTIDYSLEYGESVEEILHEKLSAGLSDILVMHHDDRKLLQRVLKGDPTANLIEKSSIPLAVL